jgi:hypothetical protein
MVKINIPETVTTKCSLQCALSYDYKPSPTCTFAADPSRNPTYFAITYDDPASHVMYNSKLYKLADKNTIMLFTGGIHRFNGDEPELEIVIKHQNENSSLYLCIPVTNSPYAASTTPLDIIVDTYYNNRNTTTLQLNNFILTNLIPKSSYIVHQGPYLGNNANSTYIVFPKNQIKLSSETVQKLTGIPSLALSAKKPICPTPFANVQPNNSTLVQNEKGTTVNGFSGDGQIYIDCQPTNSDGEIVVKETIVPTNYVKFNMSGLIYFVVVIISCILLVVLYQKLSDLFSFTPK